MNEPTRLVSPRRWWVAALLGLFGIGVGYLYVGRPRAAATAALLFVLVLLALFSGSGGAALIPPVLYGLMLTAFVVPVWTFIAPIVIAFRTREYHLRPFNRWWIYASAGGAIILYANVLVQFDPAVQVFRMTSASSLPTIVPGDMFVADMTAYDGADPTRGDLVLFAKQMRGRGPLDKPYVSRVIGLPGDRIKLVDGIVHLNGQPVDTKAAGLFTTNGREGAIYVETLPGGAHYRTLKEQMPKHSAPAASSTTSEVTVAPGCYFVLSDNRDNAIDSRAYGDVCKERIVGSAKWLFWSFDFARLGLRLE